jgi:hypothetical protein
MKKTALLGILVLTAGAAGTIATSRKASASDHCRKIRATIIDTVTSEDCSSPVGVCTVGTVTGSGLRGSFQATAESVIPGATPGTLSIDAFDTITTPRGTLTLRFSGLIDPVNGVVTFVGQSPVGTGRFEGVTGRLYANGAITPSGAFRSAVSGELCYPDGADDEDEDDEDDGDD